MNQTQHTIWPQRLTFGLLCCLTWSVWANHPPVAYQAEYQITRGDKPTAQQSTELIVIKPQHYKLTDRTKGTHGLASVTGFERTESTEFTLDGVKLLAINHRMKQDVAYSKREFQFNQSAGSAEITGKHQKKACSISSDQPPVSAHMIPWWLGHLACNGMTPERVNLLKSKQP